MKKPLAFLLCTLGAVVIFAGSFYLGFRWSTVQPNPDIIEDQAQQPQ